jgi:hypothetical protein
MSFLSAVTFAGFVAFATYLPTYLKDVYSFDLTGVGTRTAGFAIAAVIGLILLCATAVIGLLFVLVGLKREDRAAA